MSANEREREANARLIAAAPDLLAALHRLLNMTDHPMVNWPTESLPACYEAQVQAHAAIAKAEGGAA